MPSKAQRWQFLPELGCQLTASVHIAAVCLICLSFCGLAGNLLMELVILILYSLCCSVFAMTLRQICGHLMLLSAALPLVIVAALVICPVFFNLGALRQLQYLLPPTYYINAAFDSQNLLYMARYTGAAAAAA